MENPTPPENTTPPIPQNTPPPAASMPVTPSGAPYQPPVTPPTPQTPPTMEPEPTYSKSKMPLILGLLVLLLILGGAGWYVMQMQKPTPKVEKIPMPTMQPPPTVMPTDTPMATDSANASISANWKTYTSQKHNFSFQYPSDWDILELPSTALMVAPQTIIENAKNAVKAGVDGGKYETIVIDSNVPSTSYYKNDAGKSIIPNTIMINDHQTTQYQITYLADLPGINKGDIFIDTILKENNKMYLVELLNYQYKTIYDQMLSTFTFTK